MKREESDYGLSPAQYHLGVSKLWIALGNPAALGVQDKDVFTIAAERLELQQIEILRLQKVLATASFRLRELAGGA